jgi:hypothetical protein
VLVSAQRTVEDNDIIARQRDRLYLWLQSTPPAFPRRDLQAMYIVGIYRRFYADYEEQAGLIEKLL